MRFILPRYTRDIFIMPEKDQSLTRPICDFSIPCLTKIIEALEAFQGFESDIKAAAIALYASELGVTTLHFYAIALYAGLGGAVK